MANQEWESQTKKHSIWLWRQTKAFLKEFVQSGHKTNKQFREYFFGAANDSMQKAYDEFETEEKWDELSKMIETYSNGQAVSSDEIPIREARPFRVPKRMIERGVEKAAKKQKMMPKSNSSETHSWTVNAVDGSAPIKMRFGCLYCQFGGSSANEVYGHWLASHTGLIIPMPFRFFAIEMARCFYCSAIGTYRGLIDHVKKAHSNRIPMLTEQDNPKNCGICHLTTNGLHGHFQTEHPTHTADLIDPIWLTNQRLDQLLSIDVQRKKGTADATMATPGAYQLHVICGYCQSSVENHAFLSHLESHPYDFKCLACDFQINNLNEMVLHEKSSHSIDTMSARCAEYSAWLRKQFLNTKIVFNNGLILSNHNLHGTKYDSVGSFAVCVEQLIESKKRMYQAIPFWADVELKKQNELRNNLCIVGIPRQRDEELPELVLKLAQLLGVPMLLNEVVYAKHTKGSAIIVCLTTSALKDLLVNAAATRRLTTYDLIKLQTYKEATTVYVNSQMTIVYRRMWDVAMKLVKKKVIHSVELTEKGLMLKRAEGSDDHLYFVTEQQLRDFADSLNK